MDSQKTPTNTMMGRVLVGAVGTFLVLGILSGACGPEAKYRETLSSARFGILTYKFGEAEFANEHGRMRELPPYPWSEEQVQDAFAEYFAVTVAAHRRPWFDPGELQAGDVAEIIEALRAHSASAKVVHTYPGGFRRWEIRVPKLFHYDETLWEVEEFKAGTSGGFTFINDEAAEFIHCAELDVEEGPSDEPGVDYVLRFTKDFRCWYEKFDDDSDDPNR